MADEGADDVVGEDSMEGEFVLVAWCNAFFGLVNRWEDGDGGV